MGGYTMKARLILVLLSCVVAQYAAATCSDDSVEQCRAQQSAIQSLIHGERTPEETVETLRELNLWCGCPAMVHETAHLIQEHLKGQEWRQYPPSLSFLLVMIATPYGEDDSRKILAEYRDLTLDVFHETENRFLLHQLGSFSCRLQEYDHAISYLEEYFQGDYKSGLYPTTHPLVDSYLANGNTCMASVVCTAALKDRPQYGPDYGPYDHDRCASIRRACDQGIAWQEEISPLCNGY